MLPLADCYSNNLSTSWEKFAGFSGFFLRYFLFASVLAEYRADHLKMLELQMTSLGLFYGVQKHPSMVFYWRILVRKPNKKGTSLNFFDSTKKGMKRKPPLKKNASFDVCEADVVADLIFFCASAFCKLERIRNGETSSTLNGSISRLMLISHTMCSRSTLLILFYLLKTELAYLYYESIYLYWMTCSSGYL